MNTLVSSEEKLISDTHDNKCHRYQGQWPHATSDDVSLSLALQNKNIVSTQTITSSSNTIIGELECPNTSNDTESTKKLQSFVNVENGSTSKGSRAPSFINCEKVQEQKHTSLSGNIGNVLSILNDINASSSSLELRRLSESSCLTIDELIMEAR